MATGTGWEVSEAGEDEGAIRCAHCGRPFRRQTYHDLHLGVSHEDALSGIEHEAYERAREEEADDLFVFHLKLIAALSAMYAFFVLGYMVFAV
jgi:hypothetical protein